MNWKPVLIAAAYLLGWASGWSAHEDMVDTPTSTKRTTHTYTIEGSADMREQVACEFEEPLKYITLLTHWYDTNAEMYADYLATEKPENPEPIWGWSDCVWQPEDNWAACDIYAVKPEFVHADMNIDTLGHELLHGACGDYHE